MSTLTFAQLEQLWIDAGGTRAMAPVMAAIALAESGGNPTAANYTDNGGRQTSWGLWQISDGTHREPTGWSTPLDNARMAVAKYQTQGLTAWGTYDSGAYLAFLHGNAPAAGGASASSSTTASSSSSSSGSGCKPPSGLGIINPAAGVSYVWCQVQHDALKALLYTAGVGAATLLVVGGVWRTVSPTVKPAVQKIGQTVKTVGAAAAVAA